MKNVLKKIVVSLLFVILALVIVSACMVALAVMKPGVALKPLPLDVTAALVTARMSSHGISVGADAAAALAGVELNGAAIPGLTLRSAGGTIAGESVRLALAGTYVLPQGIALLGGRRLPVSASVRIGLIAGARPVLCVTGATVGRLPIPSSVLNRALWNTLPQIELPDYVTVEGTSLVLELSKIKVGGLALTSCRLEGGRVVVDVALPPGAAAKALAYFGRVLARNRPSIEQEANRGGPAAPLMKEVAALAPLLSDAGNEIAVVEYVDGNPSGRYAKDGAELLLSIGDALFTGATVLTDAEEAVEIRLADRSLVRLSEGTNLSLSTVALGGMKPSALELATGAVRVKVASLAGRADYRVRTSSVVVGVRGTEFLLRALAGGGTEIAVVEGTVEVSGSSGPVAVGTGSETTARADGTVRPPGPISGERRRQLDDSRFATPASVLEQGFAPDPFGMLWTVVRHSIAQWHALPDDEKTRIADLYGGIFSVEGVASILGVSPADLERLVGY